MLNAVQCAAEWLGSVRVDFAPGRSTTSVGQRERDADARFQDATESWPGCDLRRKAEAEFGPSSHVRIRAAR